MPLQDLMYHFQLFVVGAEPNSRLAQANLLRVCQTGLARRYEIEVIDITEDIQQAFEHNIIVTPTLIARFAQSTIRILGNLSDRDKVRSVLGLTGEGDSA